MSDIFDIVLLAAASIMALGSIAIIVHGLRARSGTPSRSYGVQRQENRRVMLVSISRGAVLFLIALIIFSIRGLLLSDEPTQVEVTPDIIPTPSPADPTEPAAKPRATPLPTLAVLTSAPVISATLQSQETPASTPAVTIDVTAAPSAETAVVNSVNGLWLRSEPDIESESLELILHETLLIVLLGKEPLAEPLWQQVRTPSGREGWVFIEYIDYQEEE